MKLRNSYEGEGVQNGRCTLIFFEGQTFFLHPPIGMNKNLKFKSCVSQQIFRQNFLRDRKDGKYLNCISTSIKF